MSFLRKPSDPHAVPSVFPTFLIPSIPFRRKSRQSSTDSTDSFTSAASITSSNPFSIDTTASPTPPHPSSPILPPEGKFLSGHSSHIRCAKCSTDLCLTSQIISKGFTGRHGRAYLVQGHISHIKPPGSIQLPNTYQDRAVPRNLVTGQHTVSDISCAICGTVLGWKYVEAAEESQKYKVGKFILETKKIRSGVSWENHYDGELDLPLDRLDGPADGLEEMTFNSDDEDECEDLFAGVWSAQLAAKRRSRKRFGRRAEVGSGSARARSAESWN